MSRATLASLGIVAALAGIALQAGTASAQAPHQGPGGPILVVSGDSNAFGRYYAEILRNEGLNEFDAADLSDLDAPTLAAHDVVILGETAFERRAGARCSPTGSQAGGNLIAMRPDPQLAGLLGSDRHRARSRTPTCRSTRPRAPATGHRRPDDAVPRHGRSLHRAAAPQTSRRCTPTPTTATANPAVTLRSVGVERGPGGGLHLRPRALGRLHAPGQPGVGRPGARRQRARSARTTCSSGTQPATRSPTGSTSTRSRSRRPTSSSACSPT